MTFTIAFKTIKYLRINLAKDAQDLYPENYLKKNTAGRNERPNEAIRQVLG